MCPVGVRLLHTQLAAQFGSQKLLHSLAARVCCIVGSHSSAVTVCCIGWQQTMAASLPQADCLRGLCHSNTRCKQAHLLICPGVCWGPWAPAQTDWHRSCNSSSQHCPADPALARQAGVKVTRRARIPSVGCLKSKPSPRLPRLLLVT